MQFRSGAQPDSEESVLRCYDNGENWGEIYREFFSFGRAAGGVFAPEFFTARLQPQMEKYRCLWYKSSSNHNILYFARIFLHQSHNYWILAVESSL